jgi:excisionase family DNA binding protein
MPDRLHAWDKLSNSDWPTLLIGNGLSINVWSNFSYTRLLAQAGLNDAATTRYTPPPGERPGDPVDEEIRREYEKRFGEPAPKVWGERRLISVAEAREWLGGISRTTLYALVKEGELSLVKIGRRSFVQVEELDDFVKRRRDDASGRTEDNG